MKTKTKTTGAIRVLLCVLTLIIGLMLTCVISAAAEGEGTTPAPHTHAVCGEAECTHDGAAHTDAVTYTALTQMMLDSVYDATSGTYLIPAGNYYLAENITAKYYLSISDNVSLCLNGLTLSSDTKNIAITAGTTSVCDCSAEGVGKMEKTKFAVAEEGTVLNIYGGNYEQGGTPVVDIRTAATVNIYGGQFTTRSESGDVILSYANLNVYGGWIQGSRNGIYAYTDSNVKIYGGTIGTIGFDGSDAAIYAAAGSVQIFGGTLNSSRYGVYSSVGATISQAEGKTISIHGDARAIYALGTIADMVIGNGTYTSGDEEGKVIEIRGKTAIVDAPVIEGYLHIATIKASNGDIALDVTGYTGTEKLQSIFANTGMLKQDTIIAIGGASRMELPYNGWELVDDVDDASNAVVKMIHNHFVCGETICTHAGAAHSGTITWITLTQELLDSYLATDRGEGLSDAYLLPAGNYVLGERIGIGQYNLIITGDTTICFCGRTIGGSRSIIFADTENITLNLTDCQGTGGMVTSAPMLAETEKTGLTINIYGGTYALTNNNIFSISSESTVLNLYGGTLVNSSSANINRGTFNMYGGTIEASNFAISINGAKANFYGGKLIATGTASNTAALRIIGASEIKIVKLQIESGGIGIFAGVLANITIQPEHDEDVVIHAQGIAISVKDDKSVAMNGSSKEGDGTPESWTGHVTVWGGTYTGETYILSVEEGKMVVNGGHFTGTQSAALIIKRGIATINGGSFKYEGDRQSQAVNVQSDGELFINGGDFKSIGNSVTDAVAAVGKITISGAPTFNNNIRVWNIGKVGESTEYWLDFSGYTGSEKLNIELVSSITPAEGMVVALGAADQFTLESTSWMFASGRDAENNAVIKITCAEHKGDETATCTTPGICTNCGGSYTLPHTYGAWVDEIPATCRATGTLGYQTCSVCQFHYDADHVKLEQLTIAADPDAHDLETHAAKEPTCTETGWDAYVTCTREGCGYTTYVEKAELGHDMTDGHTTEEEHWYTCSRCEVEGEKVAHVYDEEGLCTCGAEEPGLGGGAIAAIVIVIVLVAGIGGFAIFWFAIKKKNFKDLIVVFKKKT